MKKTLAFILLALFCICGYAQTIDPVLLQEMGQRTDDEKIKVIVIMKSQYDRQQLGRRAANYATRAERREFVVNELKQFAETSQYELRATLSEMERQDMTTAPKIIYMANALYFSATKQAINDLAMRRDIELIGLDEKKQVLFDEEPKPANMTREITSNVTQVNADQVWDLGYTGQGVVVAVIDTGVNYNHLDLADHLWDGGSEYPYHGYNFAYESLDPMDDHGHGTHCAGTVCGDGTAGYQTGMAPDATLMCVKVLDDWGWGYASVTCNAMQWAVEQGCDLFSMSLGWDDATYTERMLFRNTCAAILDAGVIGAIAAGNNGDDEGMWYFPIPDNVGTPGSCPPPYMDPVQGNNLGGLSCALCVGAVDENDYAAYFTSQGPVTWSDTEFGDYPYTESSSTEFGLIRPDVCAPGVDIISAYSWDNSGYTMMSGTSMATPCVAGCISLMLSKNIDATPAEICQILEETAVSLDEGKSNIYGYGRVDVLAAINALNACPLTLESFAINDEQGNNDGNLNAGETVTLDFTLLNDSNDALYGATLVLSTESEYVTITNGWATLPHFDAGQTQTIENIFAFTLNDNTPGNMEIQFAAEIFIDGESVGIISFNIMVYGFALKFNEVTVLNDNNGNGVLDAGETANLHVVISNVGNEPATSIVGTLFSAFPHLVINEVTGTFGDIEIDGQASADFSVTLLSDAPEVYVIDLSLDLVDENEKHCNLDFKLLKGIIVFADSNVKAICVSHWDTNGDGELSYDEASSVWDLNGYFENNSEITSFDELQYFTGLTSIYYRSFVSCSALTSIVLPNSITNIDQSAFSGCSSLTSITIGNSVTSIGIYAFALCNGLTEVHYTGDIGQWCNIQFGNNISDYSSNPLKFAHNLFIENELVTDLVIPETVTEIKRFAFYGATCLTSVTIPNSITSIGSGAFSGCNGLNAVYYGGDIHQWCNIQFTSNPLSYAHNLYINNELLTDLLIPETVTEIKPNTFSGATCLTSLTISNSVTSIGNSAFAGCSGLTNLTLGNSVVSIDNYAFRSCSSITSLSIPNSVTSIGKYVFDGCRDLTSLTLGNSVTSIDEWAFGNCNNLNAVYYTGDIQQWCNIQFNGNFWSNPLSCAHNLYINNELLTDLLIPGTVTEIKPYTFYGATCLTSLTLPNSVTSIDASAFDRCSGLNAIYYLGDIHQWCTQFSSYSSNPLRYAHNLYIDNELVTDLVIPETVTEIKPNTFSGATCLTSLTIGNTVTSIGNYAFSGCSSLASVNIGNSVTSIGEYAFLFCTGLNSLTIGDSVASIGYAAFSQCRNLFVITILAETPPELESDLGLSNPNVIVCVPCGFEEAYSSVSWGGFSNFYGMCGGSVTVVANPEEYGTVTGGGTFATGQTCTVTATPVEGYAVYWTLNGIVVSYNAEFTFYVSGDMTLVAHFGPEGNIVFADPNVKAICVSHWDVNGDGELSYLEAASVTNLGTYFNRSNITSFDELQYFTGLTTIGNYAFSYSSNLASIILPISVTTIGNYAFSNCGSLASIVLPNSIITIGNSAFSHCYNLTDSLTIPNSVTSIGDDAFISCSGLTTLIIGNSVTTIGSDAFGLCTGLTSITFGNSVTTIGSGAFIGCSGLTTIDLPNSITTIGSSAFKNCSGLTTIDFPHSVTTIGSFAFSYCSSLASIVLPSSVTSIGAYAFDGCDGLDAVYYTGDIHQWCSIQFDYNGSSNPLCYAHNLFIDDELVTDLVIPETVTEIKPFAFYGATCLTSLTLSNSVTSICESAFYNCSNLTGTLTIPNSVTAIGHRAFCYCGGFTGISIGNSVTTIGNAAFYYCTNLQGGLTIPNTVIEIGNSAFENCMFLSSLTIGNAVTSICGSAFYFCIGLESITVLAETPPSLLGNYVFSYVSKSIPVYIPCGTMSAYSEASGWNQFTNYQEILPYELSVSSSNTEMGTASIVQEPDCGVDAIVQAVPIGDYHFFNWTENGEIISTEATCSFTLTGDRNLVANFDEITNHWTPNENDYEDNMTFTCVVQLDGVEQRSTLLELGAFCGEECRGSQMATYFAPTDHYIYQMTVFGEGNDVISFRLYDHLLQQELLLSPPADVTFNTNGYGSLTNPYVLNFTSTVTHTQALNSGWNWWSTYIELNNNDGLSQLENSIGSAGILIKSRNSGYVEAYEYNGETNWYGTLSSISNEQMYKIRTNAECNAIVEGWLTNPADHPITINNGWNWIGFPCNQNVSVDEAMSGFTPENNDIIKSRNGYSTYYSDGNYNMWYGTLNTLESGKGYMYRSNSATQKTLVFTAGRGDGYEDNITPENNAFRPADGDFADNMTLTAVVEMDGEELRSEDYELAAFVGDECRGSVRLMYVEPIDRYIAFLTIFGERDEELYFQLTDGIAGSLASDQMAFAADGIVGTLDNPFVMHFGTLDVDESALANVKVYPNPSEGIFNIEGQNIRKVEVFNAFGQSVYSEETRNGFMKLDLTNRAAGIYLIRIVTNEGILNHQIIKK